MFLIVTIVVWLGDAAIRYLYHKLRQLRTSSQTLVVQYHRGHGEESVSLLDNETAAVTENDNHDNDINHNSSELIEHNQLY